MQKADSRRQKAEARGQSRFDFPLLCVSVPLWQIGFL
jgi:hypothetical protein